MGLLSYSKFIMIALKGEKNGYRIVCNIRVRNMFEIEPHFADGRLVLRVCDADGCRISLGMEDRD